jgi:hypothetical protein
MTKHDTMTIHNEEKTTMKEHAMTKNLSTLQALALAALIALRAPGAYAGPAGQAGKLAAKATTKAVVGETIQASAEKAAREAAQKVAREAAERAAREAAERTAKEAAERAVGKVATRCVREATSEAATTTVRKGAAAEVVKTVTRPGNILAVGAGTAAVVGSHNVSKGVRNGAEAVGAGIEKGIETVAEKNPELLPNVIREGTRPFSDLSHILQSVVALVIIGVAFWMGQPYLVSLRRRIARNVARTERESPPSRFCDREDGEVVDAEYEMRS